MAKITKVEFNNESKFFRLTVDADGSTVYVQADDTAKTVLFKFTLSTLKDMELVSNGLGVVDNKLYIVDADEFCKAYKLALRPVSVNANDFLKSLAKLKG